MLYTKIDAIAGVVIGGASLSGGKGTIMGAVLGDPWEFEALRNYPTGAK